MLSLYDEGDMDLPGEVVDPEEFVKLSEHAEACRIRRSKDFVKLKLRTPRKLYTLKMSPVEAEGVIKRLKCEIVEV